MISSFRHGRSNRRLAPYEVISGFDRPSLAARADELMTDGWSPSNGTRPNDRARLALPLVWDEVFVNDAANAVRLHSWAPLGAVIAAYEASREPDYLRFAAEFATDWARTHPSPHSGSPFAWYDLAIAMRAHRLGYILDAGARSECVSDDDVAILLVCAKAHALALADDDRFPSHSNHGLFWGLRSFEWIVRLGLSR